MPDRMVVTKSVTFDNEADPETTEKLNALAEAGWEIRHVGGGSVELAKRLPHGVGIGPTERELEKILG
jgi:hypothetical protein